MSLRTWRVSFELVSVGCLVVRADRKIIILDDNRRRKEETMFWRGGGCIEYVVLLCCCIRFHRLEHGALAMARCRIACFLLTFVGVLAALETRKERENWVEKYIEASEQHYSNHKPWE